jgi:hypothetical protein
MLPSGLQSAERLTPIEEFVPAPSLAPVQFVGPRPQIDAINGITSLRRTTH